MIESVMAARGSSTEDYGKYPSYETAMLIRGRLRERPPVVIVKSSDAFWGLCFFTYVAEGGKGKKKTIRQIQSKK